MSVLSAIALGVPAIRRLRNARDSLLAERDELLRRLAARDELGQEAAAIRVAQCEGRVIVTEYPYFPCNRAIEHGAGGRQLAVQLQAATSSITATLRGIARHSGRLGRIPVTEQGPAQPFWENDWFPPFDGAALYGLMAERAPRRYIEIGSGISTRFARQAINDLNLATRIISIDPHPHTSIDATCDEILRCRMEDMPQDFWCAIGPEDMLFVDNSHRSFPNSDVTVFFADVLPALQSGVLWGLHDILLPKDYPADWQARFYNEQYLLLAYLLGGAGKDEIMLPVAWAADQPELHAILSPLWTKNDLFQRAGMHGSSFWMQRGG